MSVKLRLVKESDVNLIFEWANDTVVRQNSFNTSKIDFSSHCQWFAQKLSSKDTAFYILESDKLPVGQIRYEINGDVAVINYSISKEFRGKGFGTEIIRLGREKLKELYPNLKKLVALVKKDNLGSISIFRKLGYEETLNDEELRFERSI